MARKGDLLVFFLIYEKMFLPVSHFLHRRKYVEWKNESFVSEFWHGIICLHVCFKAPSATRFYISTNRVESRLNFNIFIFKNNGTNIMHVKMVLRKINQRFQIRSENKIHSLRFRNISKWPWFFSIFRSFFQNFSRKLYWFRWSTLHVLFLFFKLLDVYNLHSKLGSRLLLFFISATMVFTVIKKI